MKGDSDYQKQIVQSVVNDLTKVIKILNDIDHNFGFCAGVELEYDVIYHCKQMLSSTRDNLYSGESK